MRAWGVVVEIGAAGVGGIAEVVVVGCIGAAITGGEPGELIVNVILMIIGEESADFDGGNGLAGLGDVGERDGELKSRGDGGGITDRRAGYAGRSGSSFMQPDPLNRLRYLCAAGDSRQREDSYGRRVEPGRRTADR